MTDQTIYETPRTAGRGVFVMSAVLTTLTVVVLEPVGAIFIRWTWLIVVIVTAAGVAYSVRAAMRARRWWTMLLGWVATVINLAGFGYMAWFLVTDPFSPLALIWRY